MVPLIRTIYFLVDFCQIFADNNDLKRESSEESRTESYVDKVRAHASRLDDRFATLTVLFDIQYSYASDLDLT